ncbi:leukocyte elastase inhibitor C-like [Drosophila obscura]|uniref:leukocyte elastase inhibitor C-like n=1 Tax=Drosophila obscura TaxID=7282 RepID=UPI001BB1106A|nr:leukocyte elastase inhibitor C-like [Drosophila obscura]
MLLRQFSIVLCVMALVHADFISNQLFSLIYGQNDRQNFVISPVGVRSALALLYAGARGATANELKYALELVGETKKEALKDFKDITYKIVKKDTTMRIPFGIFVDTSYPLMSDYQELAYSTLNTRAVHKSFKHTTTAAKAISVHTYLESGSKIDDIVRDSDITSWSNMALTSGFFFRGEFEKPFLRMSERQPYDVQGRIVHTTMYTKYDVLRFGTLPELGGAGIEIPYKEGNLSLVIVMSPMINSSTEYQAALFRKHDLLTLTDHFTYTRIMIQMPQFSIDYETSLHGLLWHGLGLNTLLQEPDFSGLSEKHDLRLGAFKHKGIIEMHGGCDRECPLAPNYVEKGYETALAFIVNQPFVFLIKDQSNIYLAGKLLTPMSL